MSPFIFIFISYFALLFDYRNLFAFLVTDDVNKEENRIRIYSTLSKFSSVRSCGTELRVTVLGNGMGDGYSIACG